MSTCLANVHIGIHVKHTMKLRKIPQSLIALLAIVTSSSAATYTQDFTGAADGIPDLGDGTVFNGTAEVFNEQLRLTLDDFAGGFASFAIPAIAGSSLGWVATFDLTIIDSAGANDPADGLSFNYGNAALTELGSAEEGMASIGAVTENISFEVDTWMNGDPELGVNIAEKVGGVDTNLAFTNGSILADGTTVSGQVEMIYDRTVGLSFTTTGLLTNADFSGVATTFSPDDAYTFIFSARVGGANETVLVDNIVITTGFQGNDTDGDGIPDSYEDANGLDKTVNDAEGDLDSDDLSNIDEYVAGSDPQDDDSDDDGLKDGAETNTGIYVSASDTGTNPLSEDTDSDGLLDLVETNTGIFVDADDPGTNPNLADTDNDGFDDGSEIASSTDPNDDTSVPAGWAVRNATSSVGLNSIADTRNLFATPANILDETNTAETNINFRDNAAGPFPNARAFPVLGAQDVLADDYGILATGTIFIGDPGIYTFGFNSDDGGGLFIDGEVATIADVNRGSTTSLGAISLSYGNHVMEFVYWERGGGAQVQLFAAKEKGDKTGEPFDVAKYKLLETSFAELVDSDNDGLDDGFEIKFFGDLSPGPDDDSDIDGLTNLAEAESGLDPTDDDTDDDGLKDGVEDGTGTFVSATQTGTDPSNSDSDGDGLADGVEDGGGSFVSATQTGSDPNKADTDGDSVKDGAEVAKGRDPTVPQALPSGYLQDFDGFADGTTDLGDGSVMNGTAAVEGGQLVLTRDGVAGGFASFMIPPLKGSENGWTASFDLTITDSAGANEPADGFSFNYGNFELTELGNAEEGMGATGGVTENISFEVDTWMNLDAEQGVNIAEKVDGTEIDLSFTNGSILADGTSVSGPVTIVYDPEEGLSFTTEGLLTNADFENIATTFLGDTGYNFGFSARVGGANQTLAIDNLQISLGGAPQDNFRIISIENVIVPGGRGNPDTRSVTVTWNSSDRKIYQVFASSDLSAGDDEWDELDDSVSGAAGAETTSYTESGIPAGTVRRFYQIREVAN